VVPVPAPGDEAALLRAAEQLRRVRLDRSRPLWQMWLLPGLPEGRVWRCAFPVPEGRRKAMLVTDIGYALAGLTAVGIIFIDARFLLAPSTAAAGFGIAAWHDGGRADPYLSVKGVRDIASGLIAVILLAARMPTSWAGSGWQPAPSRSATPSSCCAATARRPPSTACTARRP
jgi:hypothetical protein